MNIRKRVLISFLLIFVMVFEFSVPLSVSAVSIAEKVIPKEAENYVYNHYKAAIKSVKMYEQYYSITAEELENVQLGTPFVVYELAESEQDEIYYYPILNSEGNVILLLSVMGTMQGWSISVSEEWVEGLRKIGDISSEVIFYKSEDNVFAEKKGQMFCIAGGRDWNINYFQNKTYKAKQQEVSDIDEQFIKTDTNYIEITNENKNDTYTPSFSTSTNSSKICSLYNKKGQGNLGLCWAASVATICNYRRGKNITAKKVADKMGVDYNKGTNVSVAQQALKNFGVSYQNLNFSAVNRMTWTELKNNIKKKCPVYVSAKSSRSGHAVAAYGYTIAAGIKYVVFWNPGPNGGKGKPITVEFKSGGTSFAYSNETFTWTYSVSKY